MTGAPKTGRRPPRVAEWIVRRTAPLRDLEPLLGDLAEEFARLAETDGAAARSFYWRQALRSLPANARRRLRELLEHSADGLLTVSSHNPRKGDDMMTTLLQECGLALRSFRRHPRFVSTIVVTLALAISAVTVIFGVVDGLILSPFPFPEPDRLVTVGSEFPKSGAELSFMENLSPAEYVDLAREMKSIESVVAFDMGNRQITIGEDTRNTFSAFWWGDALPVLGTPARLGRGFSKEEIASGAKVAVVSDRFFRNRLGADPSRVGASLLVNGEPYALVGVLAPRVLVYGTDLWIPMSVGPEAYPRGRRQFQALGRIAPDRSLADVNAELEFLARRTESLHAAAHPEYERWRLEARSFTEVSVAFLRPAGVALAFGALFVLGVVITNVSSLLLARAVERSREMATRLALGASRMQIVRQLSVEALTLTATGTIAGVILAALGMDVVSGSLGRLPFPMPGELALSGRVIGIAVSASALAAFAFGLTPAWSLLRGRRPSTIVGHGTGVAEVGRLRAQRVFLGVQVAFAALLVCSSGLLARGLLKLRSVEPGFDATRALGFRTTLADTRYRSEGEYRRFFERAQSELRAIPGVEEVAIATQTPPFYFSTLTFFIEGEDAKAEGAMKRSFLTSVTPSYFRMMGLRLIEGRLLSDDDRAGTPFVTVLNEAAAQRYFPHGSALGKRLRAGSSDRPLLVEVVGVVASMKNRGLDAPPQPELFAALAQTGYANQLMTVVRASVDPVSLVPSVRRTLAAIDPQQPIYQVQSLDQSLGNQGLPRRIATSALLLLAAFSLSLAGAGVYAVSSYVAAARSRELGLRIALGASSSNVRAFVARQALLPVGVGGVLGILAAVFTSRAMGNLLFETRAADPLTLAAAVALLGAVAFAAAAGPARQASHTDPARSLAVD